MARRNRYFWLLALGVVGLLAQPALVPADDDLDDLQQQAITYLHQQDVR